ncbi:uncharacterized protein LOC143919272 [Arctopsyche grandis]|uniref:uncharacterized protein LOC143919272 n=1 Tax=Arctopsyche grandis TaxID=121162 RepID=UPI00406D6CB8
MTIIEGVGDEVTQFCLIVLCGIIALLAWWSTAQQPHRFRTAVILDRNVRHIYRFFPRPVSGQRHPQHMLILSGPAPNTDSQAITSNSRSENTIPSRIESIPIDDSQQNPTTDVVANNQETSGEDTEMNNIVNTMDMDSEASVLRNRRLAFFENRSNIDNLQNDSTVTETETSDPKLISDKDENTEQTDKTDNTCSDATENSEVKSENSQETPDINDAIRIRLKYLNDDLRLVEGSLHEPLGEFKRRHFKVELNARKLVRLIFNGQVLQREAATLQSCGLFDNCVVHCLVHQPRTQQQFAQVQQQLNPTNFSLGNINNINTNNQNQIPQTDIGIQEERDWDLSHILFTMLASLLSIAWYIHIRFSSLFGVAASLAMLGLTGIYIIAVICVYFPETQSTPNVSPTNNSPVDTAETNTSN